MLPCAHLEKASVVTVYHGLARIQLREYTLDLTYLVAPFHLHDRVVPEERKKLGRAVAEDDAPRGHGFEVPVRDRLDGS